MRANGDAVFSFDDHFKGIFCDDRGKKNWLLYSKNYAIDFILMKLYYSLASIISFIIMYSFSLNNNSKLKILNEWKAGRNNMFLNSERILD